MPDRVWVVTSFFNPARFATKRRNYERFRAGLAAAGVPCLTVECAFDGLPFELRASSSVLHVRSRDVLWQKERLLNVAITALPRTCTKVVWLDCDVLFESSRWVADVDAVLERCAVMQPFTTVVRLPRGAVDDDGTGKRWTSFSAVYERDPALAASGDFAPHGHTGFAWAARREVLQEVGLYDACIAGSADHLMAHVFAGNYANACITRIVGSSGPYREHFLRWAERAHAIVRGNLGSGSGTLRHLWHGDDVHRRYVERNEQLARSAFDPNRHIAVAPNGCWEWCDGAAELRDWMIGYFASRREDGGDSSLPG
ncbi:MAG TPA: hypothetical protein VFO89_15240 [Thermoanaerobaculia bacterium]|nr:hypothetical protein [Thermoanaerobaculia bacterium]